MAHAKTIVYQNLRCKMEANIYLHFAEYLFKYNSLIRRCTEAPFHLFAVSETSTNSVRNRGKTVSKLLVRA